MRAWVLVVLASGCFGFDPIADPVRPFKERSRAQEAAKWAGTYTFSECGAAGGPCWRYTLTIKDDGSGIVAVDGSDPTRVNAKPRVKDNTVTFQFDSYADGKGHSEWIPAGLGPAFRPGERLVYLVRVNPQAMCLRFDRLSSKLDTKELCTR